MGGCISVVCSLFLHQSELRDDLLLAAFHESTESALGVGGTLNLLKCWS